MLTSQIRCLSIFVRERVVCVNIIYVYVYTAKNRSSKVVVTGV